MTLKLLITTDVKFGKLHIKENQEINKGSRKKIWWVCDCGKEKLIILHDVCSGHVKSCGKCNEILAKELIKMRFGKLRAKEARNVTPGSHEKIRCVCDCGKEADVIIKNLLSGSSTSCGRCNDIYIDKHQKFGKLTIVNPQVISPGSHKKIGWKCDCGKTAFLEICFVLNGNQISCGKCNLITAEEFSKMKFGKLKAKLPENIYKYSHKIIPWLCDCGGEILAIIEHVFMGNITTCKYCNLISSDVMKQKKFGRLKIETARDILPGSGEKIGWLCDCGRRTDAIISDVISGKTKSCFNCKMIIHDWFILNKYKLKSLKCPVTIDEFPTGGIIPLETIENASKKFKAICPICKSEYHPNLSHIRGGTSLTCGCSTNQISFAQKEITKFIESHGIKVINEYRVNNFKYDIFIPSHNLLIEYQGLKWHSLPDSKRKDFNKHKNIIDSNYQFMIIFEDEWIHSKKKVESILLNKLGLLNSSRIRISKCEVLPIPSQEANLFYEQFHYTGKCNLSISYGVFHENKIIAAISFSRPIHQSKHHWELIRMVSDPAYRVYGVWNKLLKKFIREQSPISIISFSDNRLFSGKVYENMGFEFDSEIPPDYYWVKGQRRFHKSALRKIGEEKLTEPIESKLREAQGYKKIWDLGKKRWTWNE